MKLVINYNRYKHMPSLWSKLWWSLVPGVEFKLNWLTGETRIKQEPNGIWDYVYVNRGLYFGQKSADPNDYYRSWMEENVGRQGWDWDWYVLDNDIYLNKLTVKFRRGKENLAIEAQLKWT
jgi:hypothetical protein